jgi:hypothetical protein
MSDIVTTRVFSDGEQGITATKMNDIIGSAVIQPAFYSAKPSSSTLDPTDQLLELKGTGAYATITGSQLISSVGTNLTPSITAVRLRSFNALGNPTFEVTQRLPLGSAQITIGTGTMVIDRWFVNKTGTMTATSAAVASVAGIVVPGTSFNITSTVFRVTLTGQQTTLGATDSLFIYQEVEGPRLRELLGDVHSVSLLVRSTMANQKFGVAVRDVPSTKTLTKLCTLGAANAWTLITLPNLPVWAPGGNWTTSPGVQAYRFMICLAAGTTQTSPANDTFQNSSYVGAAGQDNFCAQPAGTSFFDIAFIQHEPGTLCSTPMDLPFTQNLDDCLRYYQKSYDYDIAIGTANAAGIVALPQANTTLIVGPTRFHKPLAKTPTMTAYNAATGAINSLRLLGGADFVVTGFNSIGKAGFLGVNATSLPAVAAGVFGQIHYTADTGW